MTLRQMTLRRLAPRRTPRALAAPLALASGCALGFALGCAQQGAPPGGPPDKQPPILVRVTPDTGAVNTTPPRVVFRFDEVVSERPQGAPSLRALFLISPREGEPDVDWRREAITVRPRRGWKKNAVYTVTMLPGLVDLRGNVRREGATATFSTGPTMPDTRLGGVVFDWIAGRAVPRPYVEALSRPDTTVVYVTQGDSTGRFLFRHLPPGAYTVRGFADANNNRTIEPREPWDSVHVALADSAAVEMYAFLHDTLGPRVTEIEVRDSVTLRLGLETPLDTTQQVGPQLFRVTGADSAPVPIKAAETARAFDERERAAAAQRDSATRAAADSGPAAPPRAPVVRRTPGDTARAQPRIEPRRASPVSEIVLTLGAPLRAGAIYRIQSIGLRGLLGTSRTADRTFTVPRAPAPGDSTAARRPGARRPPADTTRRPPPAPPDTGRRPPR
jgi:hypothetical protein